MENLNPATLGGIHGGFINPLPVSNEMLMASALAGQNAAPHSKGKYIIWKRFDTNLKGAWEQILIDDVYAEMKDKDGKVLKDKNGNPRKTMKRIRVLNGVPSIWEEDQKGLDKDFISKNRVYLRYEKGIAMVPEYAEQILEFLEICNSNINNPNKVGSKRTMIFKWNPEEQAKAQLALEEREIEAILKAKEMKTLEMKKHAYYLGVPFNDELGEAKSDDGIRAGYLLVAKRDPQRFLATLNNKEVDIAWMVSRALIDMKIDLHRVPGAVHWADGGLICKMPSTVNAKNYLVDFAMNSHNPDGVAFLDQLQQRLN